jgi:hypothetical protein
LFISYVEAAMAAKLRRTAPQPEHRAEKIAA